MPTSSRHVRQCLVLFVVAVAIRWAYAIAFYATMGDGGLTGPDSAKYLRAAHQLVAAIGQGTAHGFDWFGLDPAAMPLFSGLLALHAALFGEHTAIAYVMTQGLFDAGTCLVVFGTARMIDPRFALWAAMAAAVNPTQIVMAGQVYPDTPFVFFVALHGYYAIRWLHAPSPRVAAAIGVSFGLAALTRILIAPWLAVLCAFLLVAGWRRPTTARFAQIVMLAAIGTAFIAPVLARNVLQYGAWSLTPQSGVHLAEWVVPLVREAQDHTPWQKTYDEIEARTQERFGPASDNPFVQSQRYAEIGRQELRALGLTPMVKAWTFGAVINMASPAVTLVPPVMQLPRTGFYATPGNSLPEKVENFLFHSESALYTWLLLIGAAGLGIMRLVELGGAIGLLHRREWGLLIFAALWIAYILAVNGPVASPKYRLPIEPVLMVLVGVGFGAWRTRGTQPA